MSPTVDWVTTRDFRIKVRGVFENLSDEQRAELLAAAAEHDLFGAEFTREGHLSYDLAARPFFTFRFADSGESDEDLTAATERAESAARAWLDGRGLGVPADPDPGRRPLAGAAEQAAAPSPAVMTPGCRRLERQPAPGGCPEVERHGGGRSAAP